MASILKAARSPAVVDRLEFEARERARAILVEAEAHAAQVRQAVEAERGEVLRAAAHAGLEEASARAAALLAEVGAVRARRLEALEDELAAIALDVARKVLGEALALRPELVLGLVRQALGAARARREVVLRIHPEDAPTVRAELPRLSGLLDHASGLVLREDSALARGGVVVETAAGRVDARVEAQLGLLEQALAGSAP